MKIKQQEKIRAFLEEEGRGELAGAQAEELDRLIATTEGKSEGQRKTLIQTILPRVALYRVLQQAGLSQAQAAACIRKYMMEKIAAPKHASTARMEIVPGFYALYSRIFLQIMKTTDLQQSVQKREKDSFDVTITSCLWHSACAEYGCPELCRIFCDVDDVTYGGLRKMGFSRTQTLGYGGDCCDFHFYKK